VTADRRVAAAWSVYRDEVSDNFRIIDPKKCFFGSRLNRGNCPGHAFDGED
jgi:hypothetical protein